MSSSVDIFDFPYKILTCMGLWNIETENHVSKRLYWLYQSWAFFYLLFFFIFCFCDLFVFLSDIQRASTNLSATITVFMLIWKNTLGLIKYPKIQSLKSQLRAGLHPKGDPEDEQILRHGAKEIKSSCYIVYILAGSTITCWLFSPLVVDSPLEDRSLPLPVYIPWSHEDSPYYELAYLYHAYGGYLVAFDVLSLNLTVFGIIIQICSEYDILQKNTRKISTWYENLRGNSNGEKILNERENLVVEKMMIENIRQHQKIIQVVNEAENCYVHMMVVQFGGSACLVTVVALDLILVSIEINSRLITLVIFFGLVSLDICLFCHFGSRLISKSYDFLSCCYDLPWEAMNARNRKIISVVILKAQRPPKLTVEKFAGIDLHTLLRLSKVIYNFLCLLLHLAGNK